MHGDALLDQAAVADAAARPGDARRAAQAARALYQAKGNRPGAARAEAADRKYPDELGVSGTPG
jgi:hypothetical protein